MFWPFVAVAARLLFAAGFGWIAVGYFGGGITMLAAMVAASLVIYAAICAVAMLSDKVWHEKRA